MGKYSIVSSDLSRMHARFSDAEIEKSQTAFALQVGHDSNVHCAVDSQQTQNSMELASDFKNGNIIWDTEWASDAYNMDDSRIRKQKNPLARAKWFEVAKQAHLLEWQTIVEDGLSK